MIATGEDVRRLMRFGIVGVASNAALYVAFLLLLQLAVRPLSAAAACYGAGVCFSYVLNRTWAFDSRDTHREDLPKFLVAHGVGILSTILVLRLLLGWLRPELAQIVNVAVTALITYASLAWLGFGGVRAD